MQVSSPSKHLSRNFLKSLRQNNYISISGKEYAPCEVDDLYFEKATRLEEMDYRKELRKLERENPKPILSLEEMAKQITSFQTKIYSAVITNYNEPEKIVSSEPVSIEPVSSGVITKIKLNKNPENDSFPCKNYNDRGDQMKTPSHIFGMKVIGKISTTKAQIKSEIKHVNELLAKVKAIKI